MIVFEGGVVGFVVMVLQFLAFGHDNLHFAGGIVRLAHSKKSQGHSKSSCVACIERVSGSDLNLNACYRA